MAASKISALFMPSRLLLAFLCFNFVRVSAGQIGSVPATPPDQNVKRYPISGIVYNTVTNEPIGRALVHVNSGQEQHVAFTGSDGRFQLANIAEGNVWINAQRPGFFETPPGARSSRGYTVGSGSNDFRLGLIPEGKLSGTVQDVDGEPVEGVEVQLIGEQINEGHKQWVNRGGSTTDENGSFTIDGQMPGAVIACTSTKALLPGVGNSESYGRRCYPNSPDINSAQVISVLPGQTAHVDFSVEAVRTFNITGTVVGRTSGAGVGIWMEGPGNQQSYPNDFGVNPTTGHFVIRSVPNGTWRFHFEANDGRSTATEAVEDITVSGSDVKGLQITLHPGVEIPVEIVGRVPSTPTVAGGGTGNGALPQQIPPMQVRLIAIGGAGNQNYFAQPAQSQTESNTPPRLAFQGIPAGTYNVSAQSSGNSCVGSISYGGTDVSHEPLNIAPGAAAQPLVVNLRNDCASLAVTMHSDTKDATGTVLAIPDAGTGAPTMIWMQANSTANLAGLTPGSYHVYAFADIEGLEYANPQAMRDLPSESVTVTPNAQASMTIQLDERGKR